MAATYKRAIKWIVDNDDVTDIDFAITPTGALVADMFGKTDEKVITDIKKEIKKKEIK
jgi:hypothetical protein